MSSFTPRNWKSQADRSVEHQVEHPAVAALETVSNNLPIQGNTFVGREHDVAAIKELLDRHRLLTLVGSGGVGKTRLAIQIGVELLGQYPDGVWLADLAPISDPELVASVIAKALGMSQQEGRRVDEAIPQWVRRKKLLLILDNCEHVVETAAPIAASMLRTAPDVRIVATSRQSLDIASEVVYRLPSLPIPSEVAALSAASALQYGAIALFVDRAYAADMRFTLTDDIAPIIADICRRLDGIPLAIELAAARVKVLSVPHLAERLNERFRILTGGGRDVLPRQKTLSAMLDWSYDLLTPQEQRLFTRLGVFAGGFGLNAVTGICCCEDLDAIDILDLLASLTDKSLVVADTSGEHERYRLLESTTAYALQKLSASGQRDALARRHAEYFRDTAEVNGNHKSAISAWLTAELELDNYRAALAWALTQGNDNVLGGAITGALSGLWFNCGLGVEGRYWAELALGRVNEAEQPHIAARLHGLLCWLSSGKRSYEAAERAMQLYESVGDVRGVADAQERCAFALFMMGRLDEASAANAQALAVWQELGDEYEVAACLRMQADIEGNRADYRLGRELYTRALAAYRSLGEEFGEAVVLINSAELEYDDGHSEKALSYVDDALEILLRGKNAMVIAIAHGNRAGYRIALGDLTGGRESAREALHVARQQQVGGHVTAAVENVALLAAFENDAQRAARLLGYVDAQFDRIGQQRTLAAKRNYDKILATVRETLSEDETATLGAEGAAWSEDQAVDEALKV